MRANTSSIKAKKNNKWNKSLQPPTTIVSHTSSGAFPSQNLNHLSWKISKIIFKKCNGIHRIQQKCNLLGHPPLIHSPFFVQEECQR